MTTPLVRIEKPSHLNLWAAILLLLSLLPFLLFGYTPVTAIVQGTSSDQGSITAPSLTPPETAVPEDPKDSDAPFSEGSITTWEGDVSFEGSDLQGGQILLPSDGVSDFDATKQEITVDLTPTSPPTSRRLMIGSGISAVFTTALALCLFIGARNAVLIVALGLPVLANFFLPLLRLTTSDIWDIPDILSWALLLFIAFACITNRPANGKPLCRKLWFLPGVLHTIAVVFDGLLILSNTAIEGAKFLLLVVLLLCESAAMLLIGRWLTHSAQAETMDAGDACDEITASEEIA